mmetsp:Transcript_20468/g.39183  ORF Transcript_20468/g.39183 Transcript_20468/m.39183 type:complete len:494 (-) Transcript_20468:186-1667(-)
MLPQLVVPSRRIPCIHSNHATPSFSGTRKSAFVAFRRPQHHRRLESQRQALRLKSKGGPRVSASAELDPPSSPPPTSSPDSGSSSGAGAADLPSQSGRDTSEVEATMARLRSSLPWIVSEEIVAEEACFKNAVRRLDGKQEYLATMAEWSVKVPKALGKQFKYEVVNCVRPEPRVLVTRWKMRWCVLPMIGDLYAELQEMEDEQKRRAERLAHLSAEVNTTFSGSNFTTWTSFSEAYNMRFKIGMTELISASKQLELAKGRGAEVDEAEKSVREAQKQLAIAWAMMDQWQASVASGAAPAPIPTDLPAAPSQAAGQTAVPAGPAPSDESPHRHMNNTSHVEQRTELPMRELWGSTTIRLNADGLICFHEERFDYNPQLSKDVLHEFGDDDHLTIVFQALYDYLSTTPPPSTNSLVWQYKMGMHCIYEYLLNSEVSDSMNGVSREQVETIINTTVVGTVFLVTFGVGYTFYFLVFVLPNILSQVGALLQPDPFR